MKGFRAQLRLLSLALSLLLLVTGCVKTRTVTTNGRVVSQGPVVVSPIRGTTIRSHEDRR